MDWIKRWHTVKFIVLVMMEAEGLVPGFGLTLSRSFAFCHSVSLSQSVQEIISGLRYSQSINVILSALHLKAQILQDKFSYKIKM